MSSAFGVEIDAAPLSAKVADRASGMNVLPLAGGAGGCGGGANGCGGGDGGGIGAGKAEGCVTGAGIVVLGVGRGTGSRSGSGMGFVIDDADAGGVVGPGKEVGGGRAAGDLIALGFGDGAGFAFDGGESRLMTLSGFALFVAASGCLSDAAGGMSGG